MENNNIISNIISSTTNTINTSNQQTTTIEPYLETCIYTYKTNIDKLKSVDTKNTLDFDLINKAIYWARKYHDSQDAKIRRAILYSPLRSSIPNISA